MFGSSARLHRFISPILPFEFNINNFLHFLILFDYIELDIKVGIVQILSFDISILQILNNSKDGQKTAYICIFNYHPCFLCVANSIPIGSSGGYNFLASAILTLLSAIIYIFLLTIRNVTSKLPKLPFLFKAMVSSS